MYYLKGAAAGGTFAVGVAKRMQNDLLGLS